MFKPNSITHKHGKHYFVRKPKPTPEEALAQKNAPPLDGYYNGSEHPALKTEFGGGLAAELGMTPGTFDGENFHRMIDGDFDGHKLRQAAVSVYRDNATGKIKGLPGATAAQQAAEKKRESRAGYDFTLSAPKSVSIQALMHDEGHLIVEAHARVCKKVMALAEDLVRIRVTVDGRRGSTRRQAYVKPVSGICWASFGHTMSRLRPAKPKKGEPRRKKGDPIPYQGGDPQLHTHFVVSKYAMAPDGKLSAIDMGQLYAHQKELTAMYRKLMIEEVQALGYGITMTNDEAGFEIGGYKKEELLKFSDGKVVIDKYVEEHKEAFKDMAPAKARDLANKATRATKRELKAVVQSAAEARAAAAAEASGERPVTAAEADVGKKAQPVDFELTPAMRHSWWIAKAEAVGLSLPRIWERVKQAAGKFFRQEKAVEQGRADAVVTVKVREAVALAAEHASERSSKFTPDDIVEFAMKASYYKLEPKDIHTEIKHRVEAGDFVIRNDGKTITTRARVENEVAIIKAYRDGLKADLAPVAPLEKVQAAIGAFELRKGFELTTGQRDLVEDRLLSTNRLTVAVGDAGTGKSTSAEIILDVARAAAFEIVGLAPSSKAVAALSETGIKTITTQRAVVDENWWRERGPKSLVVMDESALVGAADMAKILEAVKKQGCRILTLGDPKQFSSVEAGSAFRQLVDEAQAAGQLVRLDEMKRARTQELREAHNASRDTPAEALMRLANSGHFKPIASDAKRVEFLASEYAKLSPEEREHSMILTGTNVDRIEINRAVRDRLGLGCDGQVDSYIDAGLTRAERKLLGSYEPGMTVKTIQSVKPLRKGEAATVLRVDHRRQVVMLQRADGQVIQFDPRADGANVRVGTQERLDLAKGEVIRFNGAMGATVPRGEQDDKGAKQSKINVINGDRAVVLGIDPVSKLMTVRRLSDQQEMQIDLKEKGLPICYASCQTGHSAQGHTMNKSGKLFVNMTLEDGTINRNSFYTNITRSTYHALVVSDATTAAELEKLGVKVSREARQDRALVDVKPMPLRQVNAFWQPKSTHSTFAHDEAKTPLLDQLKRAQDTYGDRLHLTGDDQFRERCVTAALDAGLEIAWVDKRTLEIRSDVVETREESAAQAQEATAAALAAAKQVARMDHLTRIAFEEPEAPEAQAAPATPAAAPPPTQVLVAEEVQPLTDASPGVVQPEAPRPRMRPC